MSSVLGSRRDAASMATQNQPPKVSLTAPPSSEPKLSKSRELFTCTIKTAQFSYAHLEVLTEDDTSPSSTAPAVELDDLQVLFLCRAALERFLGVTGLAVPVEVLKVRANQCWLRVPRADLGAFAAAITAYAGQVEGGRRKVIRMRSCSDWLGALVGAEGQETLWGG